MTEFGTVTQTERSIFLEGQTRPHPKAQVRTIPNFGGNPTYAHTVFPRAGKLIS